ncbi:MAG: virulence RhuM family protein, partial [Candidatus Thiodiazotropha weberae]|nr:virulence RhuM family protein [Candidatus Thiodiazotropha weberae]
MSDTEQPGGEFILYTTEDGKTRVECRFEDETIWLSQALIGELYARSKQTVSEHLVNLFEEGELNADSVVRNFRTTATDGKTYEVQHYNLEAILAVGFRVKSPRGTQFRRWANTRLQ